MISIINYGMGNLRSVQGALAYLDQPSQLIHTPDEIRKAARILLPGVGNFAQAMHNLEARGLIEAIQEAAKSGKPFLGICLGMQILADQGEESGGAKGLGLIPGKVKRFQFAKEANLKVPHIGFNSTRFAPKAKLFSGLADGTDFYYVHSFHYAPDNSQDASAWCNYGGEFVSAVNRDNIFVTQFHPEKSQGNGLRVLKNFLEI